MKFFGHAKQDAALNIIRVHVNYILIQLTWQRRRRQCIRAVRDFHANENLY